MSSSTLQGIFSRLVRAAKDEIGVGVVHWRLIGLNALLSFLPYLGAKRIRTTLYRMAGFQIGPKTVIYGRLRLWGSGNIYPRLRIGSRCRINTPCGIGLNAPVTLEDDVVLGYGLTIITGNHQMDDSTCRAGRMTGLPVTIRRGAWIAANVTILPGVTVGAGAVVGAGSVVTQDVPDHTFVAGNSARPIRSLNLPAEAAPHHSTPGLRILPWISASPSNTLLAIRPTRRI